MNWHVIAVVAVLGALIGLGTLPWSIREFRINNPVRYVGISVLFGPCLLLVFCGVAIKKGALAYLDAWFNYMRERKLKPSPEVALSQASMRQTIRNRYLE